jgi:decaprenylphospho-beta-D-erythro-pentofuranosid-2-ulose 2-reductase
MPDLTDTPSAPTTLSSAGGGAATPTNVLIVGATSGIARAVARRLAADAAASMTPLGLVLAGRDADELTRLAADLRVRSGAATATLAYDAADLATAGPLIPAAAAALPGGLRGVILAHGWLPDAEQARHDPATARRLVDVNYTSMVLLLEAAADHFERQKAGHICAISSVAGDRGRRGNYPYGASKAALSAYLQGLRSRLTPLGIPVLTVKPGFVDTAMVWGVVPPTSPLNSAPERVAGDIVRAIRRRRNAIYTPWFWRIIMGIVCAIPEMVFKRTKI